MGKAHRADGVQREAVEQVFAPLLARPVPERLKNVTASPAAPNPVWRMSAMIALVVVGAAGGWFANEELGSQSGQTVEFTRDAVRAHTLYVNEKRHAVEVNAQEKKHLIAWLPRRLENELVAPNLETRGYRLVGGRLLPASTAGPAAQFMYETEAGNRITLYIEQDRSGRNCSRWRERPRRSSVRKRVFFDVGCIGDKSRAGKFWILGVEALAMLQE